MSLVTDDPMVFRDMCFRELERIEQSSSAYFTQWLRRGDALYYRNGVGIIYAPNDPCSIVTFSAKRDTMFRGKPPTADELAKKITQLAKKVTSFRMSDCEVYFAYDGEYSIVCPKIFVVAVVCSIVLTDKLNVVPVTMKSSLKPAVVFYDGGRIAGILGGWLE